MKARLFLLLLFLSMLVSHAQGEANIWYFGNKAGLDFSSGSPVALTNGELVTEEGCATLSTSAGQLLFYTDGSTIYNKNHVVMVNGSGLMGHSSSSQSATIVPMPGSTTLYYVFTIAEESNPNGFRYSVVDITLDSGNGAVTSQKNVLTYTPTIESIGVTKHANGIDYWIVTHGVENNNFNAHLLTSSGLNTTPIVSALGPVIVSVSFTEAGTIKISPSGKKLAIANVSDFVQLYDFNNSIGVLSNERTLLIEDWFLYGAEFSPDESLLYVTNNLGKIYQFNLNAADVPASKFTVLSSSVVCGALQLGPDNKIYVAIGNQNKLSVINHPNVLGVGCNFQYNAIDLAGKISALGLPSFSQSFFFTPSIQFENACVNQNTSFEFVTNQTVLGANWSFGDGSSSSSLNPTHNYSLPGSYTVSVAVTTPFGIGTNTREITIYALPTLLSTTATLKQCDDNNDGFSSFNLNESTLLLVSSPTGLTFSYYETALDAQNGSNAITNSTTYTNQIVSNDIVFVRVQNTNGCFRVAQLNLNVSTTLIPSSFQKVFTVCDDVASGSNTDGISTFNFSSVTAEIQALYPPGQLLVITYYKNITDALAEVNAITNTSNYSNIGYPNTQNIIVRVDSQLNNECLGLGHHITLNVERIPIVQPLVIRHCDDDQNGSYGFDTSTLQSSLLNGLTGVAVSYSDSSGTPLVMTNPFVTTSQTINVTVTNATLTACSYNSTIQFIVDDLPEAFTINTSLTTMCDDETNPTLQDGIVPFDTSTFQSTILGSQIGMIVTYHDGLGNLLPSPLPNPFNSGSQTLLVEVGNSINLSCKATQTIPLVVHEKPRINLTGNELVCSNVPSFTKIINAGLSNPSTIGSHSYSWYFNGTPIVGATNYDLTVNTEGVYTVDVENIFGCVSTRTITVTASNTATIDAIEVNDLVNNNSILILVSGDGTYTYSIDGANYQSDNSFNNLLPGIYTVYINDELGCGITEQEISILGIPKFFTPNGDGTNDYWNIDGVNQQFNAKATIRIYDRFGKLLKQITPLSVGWDGTYNGYTVLSDDYWYIIELEDGRIVKGHFSLVR